MAAILKRKRKRKLTLQNLARVPAAPGVYVLYGAQGSVAYVGWARSLHARLADQLATGRILAADFSYAETSTQAKAVDLERELIRHLAPRFNVRSSA